MLVRLHSLPPPPSSHSPLCLLPALRSPLSTPPSMRVAYPLLPFHPFVMTMRYETRPCDTRRCNMRLRCEAR
ncbi:hypothetical protein PISMIDRAFT_682558 [Pisolithus microcarpus 441]|uniref:Uncharacterized protein n=1 Tax=Pisolithus microcarpus 441 TaxID=765257 RepID=A0A0C9YTP0_9AGAM|nr:hypothetical protein PISMIDRAFT_682558 [Pisolithus microcarpus 441]